MAPFDAAAAGMLALVTVVWHLGMVLPRGER
jgi:hypothetical protein